jgi:hypothetical protein
MARRAMPAHVPAYVQERLFFFWKGVFSIGFFIRNESPFSHIVCPTFMCLCVLIIHVQQQGLVLEKQPRSILYVAAGCVECCNRLLT